ncbi:hypothetical protein A2595_03510 [Candidatus Woesebacteria bacterium RIFOXYD1_FULL_31_53]|nr:MAG: hypothetical protein A2595_03510 [Candidatus Woesebacteria bacterium RIFOXYD1_FULL_31_53]HBP39648.1 hypothetical protein [Candidatus Woesebacteria bacterium]HLD89780.1 hypothetical protein [Patescibacteria group bacterium]
MKREPIIIVIIFSVFTFLLTSVMLLKMGPLSTFFTIDPDVPYLGNSLQYIVSDTIGFNTHPGTPTIILHSYALLPLRIFTHFVIRVSFIDWVYQNIYGVFHYIRYFQSLLLAISVGIFLISIYKSTRSILLITFAWLALFTFSSFPHFGITIVPETLSFLFVSVWLFVFSFFQKNRSPFIFILLSLIAGASLANKFTNLPLVVISFMLPATLPNLNIKQKVLNSLLSVLIVIFAFIVFTWPIRQNYVGMFRWVNTLATTVGVQGSGEKTFFNIDAYTLSVKMLVSREKVPSFVVLAMFLLTLLNLAFKKDKQISPQLIMLLGVTITIFIFSKYYLSYYQLTNYLIVIYLLSYNLRDKNKLLTIIGVLTLIMPVVVNIKSFYSSAVRSSDKAKAIENYVYSNPSKNGTVWLWGRSKDFAIIWIRDWTGGWVFGNKLVNNNLYELSTNLEKISTPEGSSVGLFDRCWDKLYILESSAKIFIDKYPQYKNKYKLVSGTDDIGLIESKCKY